MLGYVGLVFKQFLVVEITIRLGNKGDVYVAVGQGHNKAEVETTCCTVACEKPHQLDYFINLMKRLRVRLMLFAHLHQLCKI